MKDRYEATLISPKDRDHQTVAIYDIEDRNVVGSYERNYHSFGEETFAPFRRGDNWFALYSRSYVAISVMELPSCKYLGGEDEVDSCGFCPVEIWVPTYQIEVEAAMPPEELKKYPKENWHWLSVDRYSKEYNRDLWEPDKEVFHENFAFIAGCVWGDDSSWKIEVRDISRAHEGIIKPINGWGYYPMAYQVNDLRQAIRLYNFEGTDNVGINMAVQKSLTLIRENEEYRC